MAYAGKSEKKEHITAAIAANIWMSYEKNSREAMEDEPMQLIVMECEVRGENTHSYILYMVLNEVGLPYSFRCFQDGKVLIKKVASLLLCVYAQKSVGLGLLKAKVRKNICTLTKVKCMHICQDT